MRDSMRSSRARMRVPTILMSLLLVLAAAPAGAQEAPQELLQSALYKQQVEGDLNGAIELFAAIAETHGDDRAVAARALLQLGLAYETLERPDAVDVYRTLVQTYPDQTEALARARERLSVLAPEPMAATRSDEGLVARRIWGEPMNWGINVGAVSPDGREIAAVYWEENRPDNTGDLIVVDAETGDLRVVGLTGTGSRELGSDADTYVVGYSWSGDGARLAYSEWTFGEDPDFQVLHVVNANGSGHRVVARNPQYRDIRPRSWSSDGRWLVALITGWDDVARVGTISLEDGSITILKTLRNGFSSGERDRMGLELSPDDRYVAYAYASSPQDAPDVHVLAVDGSGENVIAAHPATDRSPFWTPDASRLVFLSDRSGTADMWAVEMADGEATGQPYVVHTRVGPVEPLGFTEAGSLMYAMGVQSGQLGIVDLDDDGVNFETATPLTDRFVGSNSDPAWSPDGTKVAYFSGRAEAAFERNQYLVIRSLEDGSERDVELTMGLFTTEHHARPQWSADSRSVLFQGVDIERTGTGVTTHKAGYRFDLETGEVQREPHMWSSQSFWLDVTGRQSDRLRSLGIRIDGFRWVSEAIRDGDDQLRPGERLLWVRERMGWERSFQCDPERTYAGAVCFGGFGGAERLIEPIVGVGDPRVSDVHRWRLSPEGGRIAYFLRDEQDSSVFNLWVRSVAMDDEPKLLVEGTSCLCELSWTPDGRHILYVEGGAEGYEAVPVQRVSADGGAPVELPWELTTQQLALLSYDPEGRRAVMPIVEQSWRIDIWSLSGFPWQEDGGRR